jgi:hypothetical protein
VQIVFLKAGQHDEEWATAAWEAVATIPVERRLLDEVADVDSISLWRVGCVVGLLDSAKPERLAEFIRAVRTRDGGPDVPIIVCGAFDAPESGLRWAHANGADDFLSTDEPAARLVRRVETFAGVSGAPAPIDRSLEQRKVIRSLRAAHEEKQADEPSETADGVGNVEETVRPQVAIVMRNVIALPGAAFVAAARPNGFGAEPAPAPAPAPSPAPLFTPAASPKNDHATWLRKRLVEIREADYFAILHVTRDASDGDVRAAFDAASRECAAAATALGDALAGPLAEVRAGLDEAFEVLGNAALRATYRAGLES